MQITNQLFAIFEENHYRQSGERLPNVAALFGALASAEIEHDGGARYPDFLDAAKLTIAAEVGVSTPAVAAALEKVLDYIDAELNAIACELAAFFG